MDRVDARQPRAVLVSIIEVAANRCDNPVMRPVGEAPQISGSVVLIILVVLAVALVVVGALVWQGCVMARRAGRGDRTALAVWAAISVVEAALAVAGLVVVSGPALLVQVGFYFRGRATPPPGGGGPGSAIPPTGS